MTTLSRWRRLSTALKTARDVSAFAGRRSAARAMAYELGTVSPTDRRDALALLASQAAKGNPQLPHVGDVLDMLDTLPRPATGPLVRRRLRTYDRRDPLPVERARTVPLETILGRFGIDVVRRGRVAVARCPFHNDHRPSLSLDLRRGLWHCKVCWTGGDAIALVMRLRGLSFAEAVREVAA